MRTYGGQAIAVYQEENRQGVEDLLSKGRVDFIFPADYREGTALDSTVKNIIRKMAICDTLAEENAAQFQMCIRDRDSLLQTMACKSAIKAGMWSDPSELQALADKVQSGEIRYCPHGRPVAVKLSKYEMEKMFKRA